ncbi:MAG: OsmC family protein [Pseudomonadota bacterium]
MMNATIKWLEHMTFAAESGSGHTVLMDGHPDFGGRDLAARPMELVLIGMGGCTLFDIVKGLNSKQGELIDCRIEVSADRAEDDPAVFTKIYMHYEIKGKNLDENKVKNVIDNSINKYSSATVMLAKTAEIKYDYKITET